MSSSSSPLWTLDARLGPPRSLSDRDLSNGGLAQTPPMAPYHPQGKQMLIHFAHWCSESCSCIISYFSPHIIFTPDTPSHLNSPDTFTYLPLCSSRTLHLLIWQTSMHCSKPSFTNASSRKPSPNPPPIEPLLSYPWVFNQKLGSLSALT